jgi:pimeloyl-ACP methyl ester carboxylesterase
MTKPARWLWKVLRILLIVYAIACLLLVIFQGRMLYFPQPLIESTPEDYGAQYSQISIPVDQGASLYAWWIPARDPAAPALIYFHGNYGNVGSNAEHAARLARTCCNVLLFDYRGYGRSSGPFPNESRIYADSEAVWRYLVEQKHIRPANILFYGHSLGGGAAVEMAKRHSDAAGLILDSTFTSVADRALMEPLYRWFPIRFLVHERFDSIHKLPSIHLPLLIIAGTADTTIPPSMSRELYAKAPGPKQLLLIDGGGHDNSASIGGVRYTDPFAQFVSSTQPQQQPIPHP